MNVKKTIGLRIDDELRAAIQALSQHLGTENISQVVRTTFMTGYATITTPGSEAAAFSRQAYREGVNAGAATVKAQIEAAIATALSEIAS